MPAEKGRSQRHLLAKTSRGGARLRMQARIDAIVSGVSAGLKGDSLAAAAGISSSLLRKWRVKGQAGEEPFATLVLRWERAAAELERDLLSTLLEAEKFGMEGPLGPDWRARAWLLERLFPEKYSSRVSSDRLVRKRFLELLADLKGQMSPAAYLELIKAMQTLQRRGAPVDEDVDEDELEDDELEDHGEAIEAELVNEDDG